MKNAAKIFAVEADLMLTHLLVYKLNVHDLPQIDIQDCYMRKLCKSVASVFRWD